LQTLENLEAFLIDFLGNSTEPKMQETLTLNSYLYAEPSVQERLVQRCTQGETDQRAEKAAEQIATFEKVYGWKSTSRM
jgi:hypothetical protein